MESPSAALGLVPCSAASSNEENPRLKLLCSFSGSIMPRPQDGKLRYVGGETRIVCLPRDIKYGELMARMRELYEGATLLKYQQPDEDLDALVSVVNDDDVINMMEEYDKLGSGDGFTRLRIFLFSHPEQESSPHFIDADERESERRYVDALNSLNDASDFRMQLQSESPPAMNLIGDAHMAEQFYNQVGLEGSVFNQRNFEMLVPQHNLRQLTIPCMGSGQLLPSISQRYNEVEAQWSPAFYSPRHHGLHDPRPLTETPSSARLHIPFGESDSLAEEYSRQQVHQPSQYDCSPRFPESVVRLQSGAISGDVSGFPGNLYHGPNVFERNRICENCQITFQRCQAYSDSHWKNGEQSLMEQSGVGSGAPLVGGPCAACTPNRETYLFNKDPNFHHGIYPKEQTDPRAFFNEPQSVERGWIHRHHLNVWAEDKSYIAGAGRLGDHYSVDRAGMNFSLGRGNLTDDHYMTSNSVHEDPRYIQAAHELGKEACHDQFVASRPHIPFNERGAQHGNFSYEYGIDNSYQGSHGHVSAQALLRNVQNPMHGAPYEASNPVQQANGIGNPGFMKGAAESSPRFCHARENKNTPIESSSIALGLDSSGIPEYSGDHKVNSQHFEEDKRDSEPDLINIFIPAEPTSYVNPSTLTGDISLTLSIPDHHLESKSEANAAEAARRGQNIYPREEKAAVIREQKINQGEGKFIKNLGSFKGVHSPSSHPLIVDRKADDLSGEVNPLSVNLNNLERPGKCHDFVKAGRGDQSALAEDLNASDIKPGPLDSENKAVVGAFKEVKPRGQEHSDDDHLVVQPATEETALKELEANNANHEHELDSENDYQNMSAIEPTKAEEEAIARGLQTIKNDDLEEIRELGTGTYGAVYHGKWKGTDVAIKKIKASCFAGRPSERERLIADFWKEAQILSSLHHPNVVSFYGVVRDGPDGSLVTITEFMVNGSLKQFLKKKDRTIDRRKRLIIAMDVAFGMEYLHGKNIVHFDLKCENLLVNMRDPHRPVCKIGDLGLSKVKQHTLVSGGVRGTLPWMAPELLTGKNNMVTDKIDVYSFGIVMWELLTGQEPYADMHCASIIGGIVNNQIRPDIPAWCDPEWKALMESCWASDPATRPSFLEISQKLRTMAAAMNVK